IADPSCGVFTVSVELESPRFASIDIGEAKSKLEIK
ncbi:hypothetical protein Gotur_033942, partial [Gossypium turneri]